MSWRQRGSVPGYHAFDTISEPGRRLQPMFLRRSKKPRRSKFVPLALFACAVLTLWSWKSSGITFKPRLKTPSALSLLHADNQIPLSDATSEHNTTRHSFHLLIPASDSNTELCKTLLSAFVMGYPAPTLLNRGTQADKAGIFEDGEKHAVKITGIKDFLHDERQVQDNDTVLIIDGYDIWFQLPPQVLLSRYHAWVDDANRRLKRRYGMIAKDENGDNLAEQVPRYTQSVVFGADKICWPNSAHDPACAAVPYSTLPKDVYGPETDADPEAYRNRPRFLNSGAVMGPVRDVRAIYDAAAVLLNEVGGSWGDQYFLAQIFGEQEYHRETLRRQDQGTGGRWLDWLSASLGNAESPLSANVSINNVSFVEGRQYEYGVGLDYESRIFQTMTHSVDDVEFISYNSFAELASAHLEHHHHSLPLFLPADLQSAQPPLSYASPGNRSADSDPARKTLLLPYSPALDNLPDQESAGPTWRDLSLATNVYSTTIPALLHVNGDKSLLQSWWSRMWFHPYSRALLRRFVRSTQTPEAAAAAEAGGYTWWDLRGGRGGVWTAERTWMGWGEVCPAAEEEVFADGKGKWGVEEGDGKRVNAFGRVLVTGNVNDAGQ